MSNEPFDPVKAGDSLASLKGLADFVDDGVAVEAHEHDRSVGAGSGAVDPPTKEIAVKATTEELLALNATPEGRAKVAEMFGFTNLERDGDDVIDIPARPEFDALVKMTGGPEMVKENAQALREALALVGVDALNYDELAEGLTPEEEHSEIVSTLAEWREILGNPMKAQAMLQKIYAHPMQEPGRSYFLGKGSPALNDAIAKLWQATTGEKIVGRKKSRGDGHSY